MHGDRRIFHGVFAFCFPRPGFFPSRSPEVRGSEAEAVKRPAGGAGGGIGCQLELYVVGQRLS